MPSASLSKMGIPTKSDSSTRVLTMPKLKYRFRIIFTSFGNKENSEVLTTQVIDFQRPKMSFPNVDINIHNSTFKMAGRPEWGDAVCKLRDDAPGHIAKLVGHQLQTQYDYSEQVTASSGQDYKFSMKIEMLDGSHGSDGPKVLETFELDGCYLSDVNYGDVSYSQSAVAEITLTIRFDSAIQTKGETGTLGQSLGAAIGNFI